MDTLKDHQNNLDLSYQKVENELRSDLNAIHYSHRDSIAKRIKPFTEKYLIKSDLWFYNNQHFCWDDYFRRSAFHFAFNEYFPHPYKYVKPINYCNTQWQRYDQDRIFSNDIEFYIYPHSGLVHENGYENRIFDESYMKILQRTLPKPLDKALIEKYKKALKFYEKLKELENDNKKWFEYIQKWDDEEFIIHNIEFRIGQNLQNKGLWKLYIEYWRLKNPKIMVGIYSRYCGFFLDDFEMRKEYEKEAEKLGIFVDDRLLDYKEFQSFPVPKRQTEKEFWIPKPKPNFDKYFRQNFAFHDSFINYLMDKTNAGVLQKLFMSCKYFFKKMPTPICHRLICSRIKDGYNTSAFIRRKSCDRMFFDQQSLTLPKDHPCLNAFKNLILSNSVYFGRTFPGFKSETFLSKVYRSEIKFLTLRGYFLPMKDYLFLTKSLTVLEMDLYQAAITNTDETFAHLEDLMITLPNANKIT
uniref:Uncharacterized protein n=1 Tax=Panagrolaimus davidi TaxID=227884 RepID=A0A914PK98_9BILA